MSQPLPESWAPPSDEAAEPAEPAAGTPAAAPVTEPPATEPAAPEVPAEVPVAAQIAAGVPAEATVTLADQRAGVAAAPVVVTDDGSLAPHPDVLPAPADPEVTDSAAADPEPAPSVELPPHMANYVPQPDGSWAAPAAQPVPVAAPTAAELADAKAAQATAENVAARIYHAFRTIVKVTEVVVEDAVKDLPPGTLQAAEAAALDALRNL